MNASEAIDIIHQHAGNLDDSANWDKYKHGFLGVLRPYKGLKDENFHELIVAILKSSSTFQESGHIDNMLVHSLWTICSTTYGTALREVSSLRRNKLISQEDLDRLSDWAYLIESSSQGLIMGLSPHIVVERYAEYLTRHPRLYMESDFILSLLEENLRDVDGTIDPTVCIQAIGVFGVKAAHLVSLLQSLNDISYTYCEPYDHANEEVSKAVSRSLELIQN